MPNFGASRLGYWYRRSEAAISNKSEINVFYDTSGSMDSSIPGIQDMVNTGLKNKLIQYYGSTSAYQNRATFAGYGHERTFLQLTTPRRKIDSDLVINIVFQDESTPYDADGGYTFGGFWNLGPSYAGPYISDRNDLVNLMTISPVPVYSIIFQVNGYPDFKNFLYYVQNGFGTYNTINLKQQYLTKKINFIYDIVGGQNGSYYTNVLANALSYFGILI